MEQQTTSPDTAEIAYDELCGALASRDMKGLWSRPPMSLAPTPMTRAHLWRWDTVAPLARRAGTVVHDLDGGDSRRALQFCNPGLRMGTTETLFGAYQYLEAGETAPAHRHTPAAIRFVLTGASVYTTVNGDACEMQPGDLILTPNWNWHDHTNHGDEPIIWFDGIDVPLVAMLESVFFENHPTGMQDVVGHNVSQQRFGAVGLRELDTGVTAPSHSPLLRYPYEDTDRTLESLHDSLGGSSVSVEYENPVTGGPAVATITCQMTRLYPDGRTMPRRETGGQIHVVYRGRGRSIIGGTEFSWGRGDVFVVPSWIPVEHEADELSDLFITSSRAVLQALHLHHAEELSEHQQVVSTFESR